MLVSEFNFTFSEAWKTTFREIMMLSNFKQDQVDRLKRHGPVKINREDLDGLKAELKAMGKI